MTARRITLEVDLGDGEDVISGHVVDAGGAATSFTGWIGLVTAIEAARSGAAPASPEDQAPRDGGRAAR